MNGLPLNPNTMVWLDERFGRRQVGLSEIIDLYVRIKMDPGAAAMNEVDRQHCANLLDWLARWQGPSAQQDCEHNAVRAHDTMPAHYLCLKCNGVVSRNPAGKWILLGETKPRKVKPPKKAKKR